MLAAAPAKLGTVGITEVSTPYSRCSGFTAASPRPSAWQAASHTARLANNGGPQRGAAPAAVPPRPPAGPPDGSPDRLRAEYRGEPLAHRRRVDPTARSAPASSARERGVSPLADNRSGAAHWQRTGCADIHNLSFCAPDDDSRSETRWRSGDGLSTCAGVPSANHEGMKLAIGGTEAIGHNRVLTPRPVLAGCAAVPLCAAVACWPSWI